MFADEHCTWGTCSGDTYRAGSLGDGETSPADRNVSGQGHLKGKFPAP
jgi:hypothetical protein